MTSTFFKGQNVRVISTGKVGTINDVIVNDTRTAYRVTIDGKVATYPEKYLETFVDEEQDIMNQLIMGEYGGADEFHLFQTWYRLKRPIEGNLYSYLASRTTFNPYQFKPLIKFISPWSEERLFIADEVGVGKTIETGIILTELLGRGRIDRKSSILVVCPGILGPKWVKEMNHRFNLRFQLHDGPSLRNTLRAALNTGIVDTGTWAVVGLQLLRQKENMDLLTQLAASRQTPLWSMVIIDESHHMRNSGTESNNLGNLLSGLTEMMVMLSATPLNLRDEDLFQQMHILNPAMFPDLQTFNALLSPVKSINRCRRLMAERTTTVYGDVLEELSELCNGPVGNAISTHPMVQQLMARLGSGQSMSASDIAQYDRLFASLSPLDHSFTRTLKREAIDHRVTREVMKIPVMLTQAEMEFHEGVIQAIEQAYLEKGGAPVALGFITNMPRRMVSSCIPAMKDYLDWALHSNEVIVGDEDSFGEVDDDSDFHSMPMSNETRKLFEQLRDQANDLGAVDTKYKQFRDLIKRLQGSLDNPQIVVFSFFVRTLKYLKAKLEADGYKVGLICGEVPLISDGKQPGRYDIIESFENGEIEILLSSEVGGEGLDFQFCQAIVNYDLPYNPMRVEQRIGRIDRFGQLSDKIIAASMYIAGTVDERIYSLLYERISIVEESVGLMEPILGNSLIDLQRDVISGHFSAEQIESRMKEIELAIEQAKIEMDGFEAQRKELMGEDFLTSPLRTLEQSNDFVAPSDAARLTDLCLKQWDGCRFDMVDADRGTITISRTVLSQLEQFMRKPGSEGSGPELTPLIQPRTRIPVIFNGSLADKYKDHVFIPPSGFWVRFLIRQLEQLGNMPKVFSLRSLSVTELGLAPGKYVVPMFEVKIEGLHVELNMAAVPIYSETSLPVKCDYGVLSRTLARHSSTTEGPGFLDSIELNTFIDHAREILDETIEVRVSSIRMENSYQIEARINSLQRGSEVRIERLMKQTREHVENSESQGRIPSEEFIRLKESQIANDAERTMNKIRKLQQQREVSFSISLISVVLLEVSTDKGE